MASCVTVVSTTSSISKTFQQPSTQSKSQCSDQIASGPLQNIERNVSNQSSQNSTAPSNRPNFLSEMQNAQEKRRVSKDNAVETRNLIPTTNTSYKDVPKHDLLVNSSSNKGTQNAGRSNVFSNSLADQLKIRLEERRRNSDDNEIQDLAVDVQKAVNIANESSK